MIWKFDLNYYLLPIISHSIMILNFRPLWCINPTADLEVSYLLNTLYTFMHISILHTNFYLCGRD